MAGIRTGAHRVPAGAARGVGIGGLCGCAGFRGGADSWLRAAASHVGEGAGSRTEAWATGPAGLTADSVHATGEALAAAVTGHPLWRDPELASRARHDGNAAALAQAYRAMGYGALDQIKGRFACAVIDPGADRVLVAADRVGSIPVFFASRAPGVVFGTALDAVLKHPEIGHDLSPQALYEYLYFHVVPGPDTVYSEVARLLPGQALLSEAGNVRVEPYCLPEYAENDPSFRFDAAKEEIMERLRGAVAGAVDGATTGAFLSGGVDSSTLAGLLGEATGAPAKTYSIGFDAAGYDEMEYARAVAHHFATDHHEYYVTPRDVAEAVPAIAQAYSQPFGNASVVPSLLCARMARADGAERLLGGDGGDELFGGNARYAKQKLFAHYERLPPGIRRRLIEPMMENLPGPLSAGPVGKLQSYVEQARVPLPDRLETYNLLTRCGGTAILEPDFVAAIDTERPLSLLQGAFFARGATNLVNRMLQLDMRFTLADSDLPKVVGACHAAGVDVAFPFLDDDVVAFALSVPPRQKVKGRRLRYFFKEAVRGFLPPEILSKKKHGFGLPFGTWLRSDQSLRDLAGDSLQTLKGRGVVRPEAIDALWSHRHREHPAYYGTMVWVLLMLEQWFAARRN